MLKTRDIREDLRPDVRLKQARKENYFTVSCPRCKAKIGSRCLNLNSLRSGQKEFMKGEFHPERRRRFKLVRIGWEF